MQYKVNTEEIRDGSKKEIVFTTQVNVNQFHSSIPCFKGRLAPFKMRYQAMYFAIYKKKF